MRESGHTLRVYLYVFAKRHLYSGKTASLGFVGAACKHTFTGGRHSFGWLVAFPGKLLLDRLMAGRRLLALLRLVLTGSEPLHRLLRLWLLFPGFLHAWRGTRALLEAWREI